jgi:hypothetical protein
MEASLADPFRSGEVIDFAGRQTRPGLKSADEMA